MILDAPIIGEQRFDYVPNTRPLWTGTVIGVVTIACAFAWAPRMGHRLDPLSVTTVIVFLPLLMWSQLVRFRRAAAALGGAEVDDAGVRWRQPGGSLGFDVAWAEVERATVDARTKLVVVARRGEGPVLIGAVTPQGVPSGTIVLERVDELVAALDCDYFASPQ